MCRSTFLVYVWNIDKKENYFEVLHKELSGETDHGSFACGSEKEEVMCTCEVKPFVDSMQINIYI